MTNPPRADLLLMLRHVEGDAKALNFADADGSEAAGLALATGLAALLEHALELFASLQRIDERPLTDEDGAGNEEPDDWFMECTPVHAPPRVSDICFAGSFELRHVLRKLTEASSADERLNAAETARRKLLRGVRAVLSAERQSSGEDADGPGTGSYNAADIVAALAVRRLYTHFRRALRRPSSDSPDAVLEALRYAAGAVATLVSAPAYAEVRASDRALLRRLRERMIIWARHDRPVEVGLQLFEDVSTCADLMCSINRRQELRAHDASLMRLLSLGPGTEPHAWLERADALFGLDDTFDELVARCRDTPDLAGAIGAALLRLGELNAA